MSAFSPSTAFSFRYDLVAKKLHPMMSESGSSNKTLE